MKFSITVNKFSKILEIAASNEFVKKEVRKNYWENQWWPLSVNDWRLRILIAGLSTRVSYRSIEKYQLVRDKINHIGYSGLKDLSENEFLNIVRPLGLGTTRWNYWNSVRDFCEKYPDTYSEPIKIKKLKNDDAILLLKNQIKGAGYKVAQCCMLYIRGYHCGIIPIDSGMKDLLGPCLGINSSKGAIGNELMRKEIENLAKRIDYYDLLTKTGYSDILSEMEMGEINTWWVHLVLIYFKREFCNLHDATKCPLALSPKLQSEMLFTCMRKGQ